MTSSSPIDPDEQLPTEASPLHFGSFELLELLGEGAMARVYRARQTGPMGFSKEVALKRLRKGAVGRDRRQIEALVNEARLGGPQGARWRCCSRSPWRCLALCICSMRSGMGSIVVDLNAAKRNMHACKYDGVP